MNLLSDKLCSAENVSAIANLPGGSHPHVQDMSYFYRLHCIGVICEDCLYAVPIQF